MLTHLLRQQSAGELNDGIFAFREVSISELNIVVGINAELHWLLLRIEAGNG